MRRLLFIMATILFIAPIFVLGQSALPKSVSGLQNIIQQLQEQIKLLQRQIGELKGQVETSKKDIEVSRQEIENIKFTRELRRGMKGDDVKEAQTFLAEQFPEFLSKKAVTGYFGVLTETAVKKFQKKYGLKTVGRVDANMIKKMNELLAEELNNNEEITPDVAQEIQKETSKQITQILPLTIIEVTSSPTILPISSPVETVPLVVSPLPIVLLPPVIAPPQTSGSASVNPSSNATTTTAPAIVAGSLQATISTLALTRDPIVRGASNVSVASFSIANSTAKNISLSSLYLVCQGCSQYASTDFTAVRLYSSSTGVQIGTTVNPIPGTSQFFNFSFKEGDFVVPASSALSFLVKIDTTPPSTLFQFPLSFYIEWRSASVYSGESINGLPLYATPSWSLIRPTSNATTTSTGTTGTATPSTSAATTSSLYTAPTSAATTTTIPESFAPPEPLNNEAGVWAQVDIATGQILSTAICTRSVCGINGEYHGYVPPSSWATGSIWWPTSKRYIWQMSGQAGYSSGTFNFSTYVFSVTGGTIFNGIFTAGSGTSSATTSSSYATTTPSTTTVVNYPGFFMTTDKQNYSPGDTISLTIRRADSGTSNVSVEFSIVAPNKTAAERTQKNYSLDVTQETTVQVSTDQEPFKSSFDGTYLLLLCAVGKNCGDGKTNSTSINYTVPIVSVNAPIGYWKFDGNGNNEITGSPNATTVGAAIFNSSGGKFGGYLYVASANDWAKIPYNSMFDLPDNFTIEFWFRQRSNQSFNQNLIYKGSPTNNYNFNISRWLWNQYNYGPVIAGHTAALTGYWTQPSNPNQLAHNEWHHVVFTKSPTYHAYYLDGVLIGSKEITAVYNTEYGGPAKTPAVDIIIGDTAVDTDFDNLKIYNYALTATQAHQLSKESSPTSLRELINFEKQLASVSTVLTKLSEEIKKLMGI